MPSPTSIPDTIPVSHYCECVLTPESRATFSRLELNHLRAAYRLPADFSCRAFLRAAELLIGQNCILAATVRKIAHGQHVFDLASSPEACLLQVDTRNRGLDIQQTLQEIFERPLGEGDNPLSTFFVAQANDGIAAGYLLHDFITDNDTRVLVRDRLFSGYDPRRMPASESCGDPLDYPRYLEGLRLWSASEAGRHDLDWWRAKLAGIKTSRLPYDHREPERGFGPLRQLFFELPATTAEKLYRRSSALDVRVPVFMYAAHAQALAKLTGKTDVSALILCGTRTSLTLSGILGRFINCATLRIRADRQENAVAFLKYVESEYIEALQRRTIPHSLVVRLYDASGREPIPPLLNYLETHDTAAHIQTLKTVGQLGIEELECPPSGMAHTDNWGSHNLAIHASRDKMFGRIIYHSFLYEERTIDAFWRSFAHELAALAADS